MESTCDLTKLNSKYILKNIFDIANKYKSFEIFRYNKSFQEKLGVNVKDYKEYSQTSSPIEIEIIPSEKKEGKIFNSIEENDQSYYHVYFDDNNEESETHNLEKGDNVSKIRLIIDPEVQSFNHLFEDCKSIETINFKRFSRINIEDMRGMFWQCSSLKEVNMNKFKTDNVTNMSWMFYRCSLLKKINIANCNIDNVTRMTGMFWGCSSLEEVNLPKFKDDNEINKRCMFTECSDELKNKIKEENKNIGDEAFE